MADWAPAKRPTGDPSKWPTGLSFRTADQATLKWPTGPAPPQNGRREPPQQGTADWALKMADQDDPLGTAKLVALRWPTGPLKMAD